VESLDDLNALGVEGFAEAVAPLFEGAPQFLERLAASRPFGAEQDLFDAARATAREMPEEAQLELLDAHPRIGADPASVSPLSHGEQGYDNVPPADDSWIGEELAALNDAYESHFGFRFVIFVAGRPRADLLPILERALHAARDEEIRRGLDDVILIAADRMERLRGPRPLREELREAIALEVSRFMVGEVDRHGLIRATHRLIEEGVESPALLALSLANQNEIVELDPLLSRLMNEVGLAGWDGQQARQLLALHAAASVLGGVTQPIDGARRVVAFADNVALRDLIERWEAAPDQAEAIDQLITREMSEMFAEGVAP